MNFINHRYLLYCTILYIKKFNIKNNHELKKLVNRILYYYHNTDITITELFDIIQERNHNIFLHKNQNNEKNRNLIFTNVINNVNSNKKKNIDIIKEVNKELRNKLIYNIEKDVYEKPRITLYKVVRNLI